MSEELKNQLIYEIADELIQKFDIEISQEILTIINKHLYKNEALFLNNKNNRIAPGGIRWILNDISKKTGVENIHPHRFRRTLATDLLNKGMAIQDVSKVLGHANVSITQTYYYHTDEKVEKEFRRFI